MGRKGGEGWVIKRDRRGEVTREGGGDRDRDDDREQRTENRDRWTHRLTGALLESSGPRHVYN